MSRKIFFVSHADVLIDPAVPVPKWSLSKRGQERHQSFNAIASELHIEHIYSSDEQKAIDGAAIMANHLDLRFEVERALHENDRSSTGYLPPAEFEKAANQFFSNPTKSIRGWEKAIDAQQRIVAAVDSILTRCSTDGNIAIISHGGVGALLLCHLMNKAITREMDQPGSSGGNYYTFLAETYELVHGWKNIACR